MCPCFEIKDDKEFCFYYQSYINVKKPCGNHFLERPEYTQEESEEIAFGDINELSGKKLEKRLELDKATEQWIKRTGVVA